ncbi:MAG: alpha/beta hydrolase [Acidobacteriota bacterium]
MKAIQILCLATLLVLAGCHRTPLVVDQPRNFPGVLTRDVTFYSSALGRKMTYRVYLPSEIPAGARLPVAYLLHGCGGCYRDWSDDSDVGAYAARGLILVMVDSDCSYYMNAALHTSDQYEDYFVHDLLTDAETRFPAKSDRAHRAVAGVSMGGFAAIELALTRPDLFGFAGAISPAVDVPGRRFSLKRWQQSMRFRTIFGPTGSETRTRRDPFVLVKSTDPSKAPYLYITAGDDEPLLPPIRRFAGLLRQRHFAYEFHTKPGGHDWNDWSNQVPGCFKALIAHIHRP